MGVGQGLGGGEVDVVLAAGAVHADARVPRGEDLHTPVDFGLREPVPAGLAPREAEGEVGGEVPVGEVGVLLVGLVDELEPDACRNPRAKSWGWAIMAWVISSTGTAMGISDMTSSPVRSKTAALRTRARSLSVNSGALSW